MKNIKTIVLVLITLLLAGAAVFSAWKLYQTREEAIAPTVPEEAPAAEIPQTTQCSSKTFTIAAAATAAPTASPAPTSSPTPTATSSSSGSSSVGGGATASPKPTSTASSSKGATSAPTATPSELLKTGTSWPTVAAISGGTLLLILAVILAF